MTYRFVSNRHATNRTGRGICLRISSLSRHLDSARGLNRQIDSLFPLRTESLHQTISCGRAMR